MAERFAPAPPSRAAGLGRWLLGVPLLAVTVFVAGLFWVPFDLGYALSGDRLEVTARAGLWWPSSRSIPLEEVTAAQPIRVHGGVRVAGTGMPGYCVGRFRYPATGDVWQATSCVAEVVRLDLRGGQLPILVSPADRDAFLAALAAGHAGRFPPAGSARGRSAAPPLAAVTALAPILILCLFFLAPARLAYEIDGRELAVRTLLGRRRFDLAGRRVTRRRPRFGMRLWGTGLPGYFTGWFFLDGRRGRVYASRLGAGVLIEDGTPVFVTPADPDGFLAAAERAGAHVVR